MPHDRPSGGLPLHNENQIAAVKTAAGVGNGGFVLVGLDFGDCLQGKADADFMTFGVETWACFMGERLDPDKFEGENGFPAVA